jgi:Transcriptional regulator containing PAS, AAA-type ATPase, and DNA-binding domains
MNHSIDEIIKYGRGYENKELENPEWSDDKMFISAKPVTENDNETEILFVFRNYDFNNLIDKSMLEYSYASKYLRTIIGNSKLINQAKDIAIKASQSNSNVLIRGESGTGKEVFARAIHNMSKNREGKFVAVNCAAIPENLMESELFGYEDGAFTGAKKGGKPGMFEMANEGTIFLDELGDLPIHLQPKLLRAIENTSIIRVGGTNPIKISARIIAATNRDLEKDIEDEKFRKDLYYRLNVIPVYLPPLRKIPEDILALARHFLNKYSLRFSKEITDFTKDVEKIFLIYDWPGNVRELENVVEYITNVENTSTVQVTSLPENLKKFSILPNKDLSNMNLKNTERQYIQELLEKNKSDVDGKIKVANELGISLSTLYRKLKSYNL